MFSLKKILLGLVITFLAAAILFLLGIFLLTLDPKDACLDQGGRYNEITKTCEK